MIAHLQPKCNVLPASVISSTQIRKRVTQVTAHLSAPSALPAVALLHARTGEVCKMITIVEQCKRLLGQQGKSWFQYNQMFQLPQAATQDVVEETVLEGEDEEGSSSDEGFEVMASRFADAVLPAPSKRIVRSMRIFLSGQAIPELGAKEGVTLQSSEREEKD